MKVAIVHYHLEPGGVTRVIENTLQAWNDAGLEIEAVVLSGRQYRGSGISNAHVVQGLDYTTPENAIHAETLSKEMEDVAQMALGSVPDIWHIHNHSLGKNPALPLALSKLAQKGARMLLHPLEFIMQPLITETFLTCKKCWRIRRAKPIFLPMQSQITMKILPIKRFHPYPKISFYTQSGRFAEKT